MFADHEMVRRAATEALCNLVPHEAMMEHLTNEEHLRLWMAFAVDHEDHYECARAAGGCLAMASQDESIALVIVQLAKFKEQVSALLESGRLELMQRALVLVLNLVAHGSTTREKTVEAGLVDFCRAYIELQQHAASGGGEELDFSEQERQLLPVTIDIAKKIVQSAEV
jgi:protein unc-45